MSKHVFGFVAHFNLGTISDQFGRCTTVSDDVKEGVDELLLMFETMTIGNQGVCANMQLCHLGSIVDGRGVREHSIGGKRFTSAWNVACRAW